jgi:DNA-binding response OmpR family regulator
VDTLLFIGPRGMEAQQLKAYLLRQGFHVRAIEADGLDRLEDNKVRFLLGILDAAAGLKLHQGIEQVRNKELPLVALINESRLHEMGSLHGLEDFLVVPARPELLEVRIRFVLGRLNHLAPGTGKKIGGLEINVDRYEVLLNGEPLELTYKEFELVKFLATHPGQVFSRDQLLNQVWGYNFIGGTRTVDVHVRRLRAKFGPKHASLVDTVRNVGYRFAA